MVCCPHVDLGNPKVGTGATSASLKAGRGGRNCCGKAGRREGKPQLFREEMGKGLGMAMEMGKGIGVEMGMEMEMGNGAVPLHAWKGAAGGGNCSENGTGDSMRRCWLTCWRMNCTNDIIHIDFTGTGMLCISSAFHLCCSLLEHLFFPICAGICPPLPVSWPNPLRPFPSTANRYVCLAPSAGQGARGAHWSLCGMGKPPRVPWAQHPWIWKCPGPHTHRGAIL